MYTKISSLIKCENCNKDIDIPEAREACIMMRKKMNNDDPRIFDIWFKDWCKDCAEKWDPYEMANRPYKIRRGMEFNKNE